MSVPCPEIPRAVSGAEFHGLVPPATALNVLDGLPKHRVQDTSCGFMRPRRRVFITNKCSKQIFSNALRAKSIVVVEEKGWQVLVLLRMGTYQGHRNTSPLRHVVAVIFFTRA